MIATKSTTHPKSRKLRTLAFLHPSPYVDVSRWKEKWDCASCLRFVNMAIEDNVLKMWNYERWHGSSKSMVEDSWMMKPRYDLLLSHIMRCNTLTLHAGQDMKSPKRRSRPTCRSHSFSGK